MPVEMIMHVQWVGVLHVHLKLFIVECKCLRAHVTLQEACGDSSFQSDSLTMFLPSQ